MGNVVEMSFNDINPCVKFVNLLYCPPEFFVGPRKIYDHHLIYVHRGKGIFEINEQSYNAQSGYLYYYGPDIVHSFHADEKNPYVISGIHFDFTKNFKDLKFPIGPFRVNSFNQNLITERIKFTDFCGFPTQMNLSQNNNIRGIIHDLTCEFEKRQLFWQNNVDSLLHNLLSLLARHVSIGDKNMNTKCILINEIIEFIHEHYNENIDNNLIARKFHFHPNYLSQLMVSNTGLSLRQYLIDFRIRKAFNHLINTDKSITEISKTVGYEDIHYFSRLFKKKFGYSPTKVKKSFE